MLIKINRQACINKYPILPQREYDPVKEEDKFVYPTIFSIYCLTLPSKSFRGNASMLGSEITLLAKKMGAAELIFMGDLDIAWRYRTHDYNPAKEGLQYLEENTIGKRFNGGLLVSLTELPLFIKHLAWMVRCNAVLAAIYFTDPGQNIIGDLCQYGNLHLQVKTSVADIKVQSIIATSKFEYLADGKCYNKFSKSNSIKGRSIII